MFKLSTASWHQTTAVVNRTESSSHTVVNRVRRSEPCSCSITVRSIDYAEVEREAGRYLCDKCLR